MYICENKDCPKYRIEQNPGGRILYMNSKSVFTGSKCKACGKEMREIVNEPPNILAIINPGDGRHN